LPGERPTPDEALRATILRAWEAQQKLADAPEVGLTQVEERGYSIEEQIALHHAGLRQ